VTHEYTLILTLTGGLTMALLLGFVTQRAGLSPIVGYLLAGTLVGPHTPGFVADASLAEELAEIGVILLMFGVGLQFHFGELLAVRRVAIPGAIAQSAAATVLGAVVAHAVGWSWPAGILFGMALAVASTVVLVRVLTDANDLHTPAGHIAVGWLVVEDLFTVIALVLIPVLLGGTGERAIWQPLAITAIKVAALIAFTGLVGTRVVPRVLDYVAGTRSRELFTLTVLVIALGIAVGAAAVFDVSMALGAFLAGMIVARSEYSLRAASEALPMRDAFAVLFFVSVGMLLDPGTLMRTPALVAGALLIVMVAKPVVAFVFVWFMRYPFRTALTVAVALSQIGEFSFILATLGRGLRILTPDATNALVAASIVSIVLNPLLYRWMNSIERRLRAYPGVWNRLNRAPSGSVVMDASALDPNTPPRHRAVIVGFGPTGRTLVRLLRENGVTPTVIELNIDAVREVRGQDVEAIYGDATRRETLEAAGVGRAGTLILGSAGMANSEEVIRMAQVLNPEIRVLARASYVRDVAALRGVGAARVYSGEGEVALAFVEDVLNDLGATPEQIERERARAHNELLA
jgi:CPA2 family monovalent cation:H+ antiporter-2